MNPEETAAPCSVAPPAQSPYVRGCWCLGPRRRSCSDLEARVVMGGIAGYMGNQQVDPIRVQRCLTVMQRRGPDASAHGHWVNSARQHVHLLSSRRRVIDLEPRADQPFQVGSRWLVYNGEVFRSEEHTSELQSRVELVCRLLLEKKEALEGPHVVYIGQFVTRLLVRAEVGL